MWSGAKFCGAERNKILKSLCQNLKHLTQNLKHFAIALSSRAKRGEKNDNIATAKFYLEPNFEKLQDGGEFTTRSRSSFQNEGEKKSSPSLYYHRPLARGENR